MLDDLPRIIARLKDKVPEVSGRVRPIGELQSAVKLGDPTPGLFVFYNGYRLVESRGTVDARWIVVVRARSVKQTADAPGELLEETGPVMEAVMAALINWRPDPGRHTLVLSDPGVVPGWLDGYAYLPLGFSARRVYSFPPN